MSQPWENPDYAGKRGRRSRRLLVLLLLVAIAAAASWTLRKSVPGAAPAATGMSPRSVLAAGPARDEPQPAPAASFGSAANDTPPPGDGAGPAGADALRAGEDAGAGGFAVYKAMALSLYRQNKLTEALEQVQATLAMQADEELLELLTKLKKEILIQRNYDNARTANFVVLFDGYEHEEMKSTVLDILKDAYGDIGKEFNHFPAQPISVILYTAEDFSYVTRAPMWSGGLFDQLDGKIRMPVQGVAGNDAALRRVLYHEFTHALLFSLAPGCPFWLNEGLAQHMSGEQAISVAQMIPLELLEKGFPRDARLAYVAYKESLQAVQDLVEEYGMARLRRLLSVLGAGGDMETAFSAAYGQSFSHWAAQWRPVQREE